MKLGSMKWRKVVETDFPKKMLGPKFGLKGPKCPKMRLMTIHTHTYTHTNTHTNTYTHKEGEGEGGRG